MKDNKYIKERPKVHKITASKLALQMRRSKGVEGCCDVKATNTWHTLYNASPKTSTAKTAGNQAKSDIQGEE